MQANMDHWDQDEANDSQQSLERCQLVDRMLLNDRGYVAWVARSHEATVCAMIGCIFGVLILLDVVGSWLMVLDKADIATIHEQRPFLPTDKGFCLISTLRTLEN